MALKKVRSPFLLFKRGNIFYAKFWDETTQRYSLVRSTGILDDGKGSCRVAASQEAQRLLQQGLVKSASGEEKVLDFLTKWWNRTNLPITNQYRNDNLKRIHRLKDSPLGNLKVKHLRNEHLNQTITWLLERGTGTRSAQITLQAVTIPLRDAREDGLISFDPKPKKIPHKRKEKGSLTMEEVRRLLEVPFEAVSDPRVYVGVLLGVLCGLRRSEAVALQWNDIDLERGVLQVRRAFTEEDGLKEPKTKGSRRTIELIQPLRERLQRYRDWTPCPEAEQFVLFGIPEGSRVEAESRFPRRWHPQGDSPMDPQRLTSGFWEILPLIGISPEEGKKRGLSFHGLRHTFVTLLVERVGAVPAMLLTGHVQLSTLQRYSHPDRTVALKGLRLMEEELTHPPTAR